MYEHQVFTNPCSIYSPESISLLEFQRLNEPTINHKLELCLIDNVVATIQVQELRERTLMKQRG